MSLWFIRIRWARICFRPINWSRQISADKTILSLSDLVPISYPQPYGLRLSGRACALQLTISRHLLPIAWRILPRQRILSKFLSAYHLTSPTSLAYEQVQMFQRISKMTTCFISMTQIGISETTPRQYPFRPTAWSRSDGQGFFFFFFFWNPLPCVSGYRTPCGTSICVCTSCVRN